MPFGEKKRIGTIILNFSQSSLSIDKSFVQLCRFQKKPLKCQHHTLINRSK